MPHACTHNVAVMNMIFLSFNLSLLYIYIFRFYLKYVTTERHDYLISLLTKSLSHFSLSFQVSGGSTYLGRYTKNELLTRIVRAPSKIPQLDGPIPDPYDDVLSTPNVSVFNAFVCGETYFCSIKPFLENLYV